MHVRVNHQPLLGLLNKRDATRRIARWVVVVCEYNITWEFQKRKKHMNDDGLSRAIYQTGDMVVFNSELVRDDLPKCMTGLSEKI